MVRKKLVAGNWKMHGSRQFTTELVAAIRDGSKAFSQVDLLVCPPYPYLGLAAQACAGSAIAVGAQNLSEQAAQGAFTGEVLGSMLTDVGCQFVLVGHSERRAIYGETDATVAAKTVTALAHGLTPVVCVGESLQQREAELTEEVIARQLDAVVNALSLAALAKIVVAYEPVWAIGTGKTASPEQAQAVHAFIRARLALRDAKISGCLRILYGGSVKPDNAKAIFAQADVDGGLIGGAALKASDFISICAAAQG
jgi:triosephosphate isomerase